MIDILISSRNDSPKELLSTLQSLQGLDKKLDYKVILVNDSEEDFDMSIVPHFLKNKIKIVKVDFPKGLAAALNYGIAFCESKYVARIDQGDVSSHERYEFQYEELANNNLSFIGLKSELLYINKDNKLIKKRNSLGPVDEKRLKKIMKRKNPIVHGSLMFKKDDFLKINGYNNNFKYAQDYDLYMRFIKNNFSGKIINRASHFHKFYINSSSTIIKNRQSRLFGIKARLINVNYFDYLNIFFLIYLLKDLMLLIIPKYMYKKFILKI